MSNRLLSRIGIAAAVIIGSIILLWPTIRFWSLDDQERQAMREGEPQLFRRLQNEAVKQGLDLQGGVYMVLEVDPEGTLVDLQELDDATEGARRIVEQRVNQFGVAEANVQRVGERRIVVELPGIEDIETAMDLVGKTALLEFKLLRPAQEFQTVLARIDQAIGAVEDTTVQEDAATDTTSASATATTEQKTTDDGQEPLGAFDEPLSESDSPVDEGGFDAPTKRAAARLSELLVRIGDTDFAVRVIDIPRVERIFAEASDRRGLIPSGAQFAFGRSEIINGEEMMPLYYMHRRAELTGAAVADARVGRGSPMSRNAGMPVVNFEVKDDSSRVFARITGANVGKRLAIVLDDMVQSAPVIQDRIAGGSSEITGMGDEAEARSLAISIRSGALPTAVTMEETRYVGPSLGADSIAAGKQAFLVGFALVVLFMALYYRGAGLIADSMLILNMLFIMATLAYFGATLTLPGVAGLILTIGMAVDANVLIFERMREEWARLQGGEQQRGMVRTAISEGYGRASSAIWDANITTFIAGAVLYQFGSGPVRGFALVLLVGIISSIFTALFVSRVVFEVLTSTGILTRLNFGTSLVRGTRIDFLSFRRKAAIVSAAVIGIGIASIAIHSGLKLGIDFAGGTRLEVAFSEAVPIEDIRSSLSSVELGGESYDLSASEIKEFGSPTDILIRVRDLPDLTVGQTDSLVRDKIGNAFSAQLAEGDWARNVETVGPKVGSELKSNAFWAVIVALAGILGYVWVRFKQLAFAVAAIVALIHDVLIVLGVFSLVDHEITLAVIASVLTVVGYSLNDTIVVFDRIREGLKSLRREPYREILNRSINETLSRTLMTSITTLLVVVCLYTLGGQVIRDFSFALLVGVLVGTYSSIFVAAPVVAAWHDRQDAKSLGGRSA